MHAIDVTGRLFLEEKVLPVLYIEGAEYRGLFALETRAKERDTTARPVFQRRLRAGASFRTIPAGR